MQRYAVVRGGVIGAAVARRILMVEPGASVTLLEKEQDLPTHQTGRNSGVVHAGLYYNQFPQAVLCRGGGELLRDFCQQHEMPYDTYGNVLVALDDAERARLADIAERAERNGVPGCALSTRMNSARWSRTSAARPACTPRARPSSISRKSIADSPETRR